MNFNYRKCIFIIYIPEIKKYSDRGFDNINNGSQGCTHWTCFYIKDNRSYYFGSFGGQPDKFLLNQLPKAMIYFNYKYQAIKSKLYGSYCLYFFNLIERINYYDTILKMYFDLLNMPFNVFGNSSHDKINKIDTSIFLQKLYLRTKYIEANKEDIDFKNQIRIKNLPDPISIREACSKNYVDNNFNAPSIIKKLSTYISE